MQHIPEYLRNITEKYYSVKNLGFTPTELERIRFFWTDHSTPRVPLLYDAGIVIILQGHKIGYLNERTFHYNAKNYLIVSMSIPFECESIASPDKPLIGITLDIDLAELHELTALIAEENKMPGKCQQAKNIRGVEPAAMSSELHNAVKRLIACLDSPLDCKVIGKSLVREIIYRILLSDHGAPLYALTQHNTYYTSIAKAIAYIRNNYQQTVIIDELAEYTGMSLSLFHRAFKEVTGSSPLQYVKKIKLTQAKYCIVHENMTASMAASTVGYESPSQFSREFKRYFGVSPKNALKKCY